MNIATTPFEQWTFEMLLMYNQANILIAIPKGNFNDAVFVAMDLTLRWKEAQ